MRLTERKLKSVIRQVIQEGVPSSGVTAEQMETCLLTVLMGARTGAVARALESGVADDMGVQVNQLIRLLEPYIDIYNR